ncbi:MAG: division/cell wall cluster transcriptional repressor MraZ [Clostridia bacterium]
MKQSGDKIIIFIKILKKEGMIKMLSGEHKHSLDVKSRIIMPSKFRTDLGDKFIITRGFDKCIAIYPIAEWEKLSGIVTAMSKIRVTNVQRYLFRYACEVEPDKQGRILIPASLKEAAGLEKDVVIVGLGTMAEIWDEQAWHKTADEMDIDEIMNQIENYEKENNM